MVFRGTQQEAFDSAINAFKGGEDRVLLVEPTGWGKTYFTAELFRYCVETWNINCLFVVHTKELAKQTYESFCDNGMKSISSLLCSGLDSKEVNQITVGTRQTISRNLGKLKKINLLVVDECHYMGKNDEYHKIISHCNHDRLRVLGLTATPYKIKGGWIYGEGKFFEDVSHITSLDQMINLGFLSPYRYKMIDSMEEDLKEVKKTGGDFNELLLSQMMQEERFMGSVQHAITDYCDGRKKIVVFAVTVDHAEALAEMLKCNSLHSKLKKDEWNRRMEGFKYGDDRIIVNVEQMTVGVNIPAIDCVIMARPTMSTALMVQSCGRSLRTCDGKKDALILDLVGNYSRHGLPSNPRIRNPKEKDDPREKEKNDSSVCPECFEVVEGPEVVCPFCGSEMNEKKNIIDRDEAIKMKEIERLANLPEVDNVGEKKGSVTKKGSVGSWFWIKLGDGKTLFKFCGNGTAKMKKERERINSLSKGDKVNIISTAYGDWIA